jgi:hypothetical protein
MLQLSAAGAAADFSELHATRPSILCLLLLLLLHCTEEHNEHTRRTTLSNVSSAQEQWVNLG